MRAYRRRTFPIAVCADRRPESALNVDASVKACAPPCLPGSGDEGQATAHGVALVAWEAPAWNAPPRRPSPSVLPLDKCSQPS